MDKVVIKLVRDYIFKHIDTTEINEDFEIYIVWKAKILKNWKYMIATTLPDGKYYEVTYNGDKQEWYLDVYKKIDNNVIKDDI